jgi:DNA-binding transcriptional ArsR family regulator
MAKQQITKAKAESGLVEEALSHPTRVRILGWLRHQEAKTQSEVGKALALSNASARYHLTVLEGADLVVLQGTRSGPNGITEKLYAYNPEVWKQLDQPNRAENFVFMLDYTFASIHEMHRKAIDMIKANWMPAFVAGSVGAFATPDETQRLRNELNLLLENFYEEHKDASKPGAVPVAITFAVLPSRVEDAQGWAGERIFDWSGRQKPDDR